MNVNEIYLAKRSKVLLPNLDDIVGDIQTFQEVATLCKNVESLGFVLSPNLIRALNRKRSYLLYDFYSKTIPILKKMVGAHRAFDPMYPNFPEQVMDAPDAELYLNAVAHYFGFAISDMIGDPSFRIMPHYEKQEREPLKEIGRLQVIDLGTLEDFESIFASLVSANSSISDTDKKIIARFIEAYGKDIERLLPGVIPQKETMAFLVGELIKHDLIHLLQGKIKTATDVLRVACAISGGDVSLAKPTKFIQFSRKLRRFLLASLDSIQDPVDEMVLREDVWKRLGEKLHPGEFIKQYPNAFVAFRKTRTRKLQPQGYNAKVETYLSDKVRDIGGAIDLLKSKPGVFARRLDHVLRLAPSSHAQILGEFLDIAGKVSTPVLVQAYNHFKNRAEFMHGRIFFPKGDVAKVQVSDDPLPRLDPLLTRRVHEEIRNVLVSRFKGLPSLAGVYVDPRLETQFVPFSLRSASKSLRTIARGSRISLPDSDVLRMFIWWKNGDDRVDIDLSALMIDDKFSKTSEIAYYRLRDSGIYHSGDITSAPNGACEFIDADIRRLVGSGHRYLVMVSNSYTNQKYCDLPECFAGWMGRNDVQSGEVFEAKTVQDKIDIATDMRISVPLIFDLIDRKAIWCDIGLKNSACFSNNVSSNKKSLLKIAKALVYLNRPNLYDLFSMHAEARGTLVAKSKAQTVFSLTEGITPFDTDKILSEFLA